jgi:hypothetical protein
LIANSRSAIKGNPAASGESGAMATRYRRACPSESEAPMSEEIAVLDDFLPPQAYEALARFIAKESLVYGSRSNFKTDPHGHWSRDFAAAGPYNLADVEPVIDADRAIDPIKATWAFLRNTNLTGGVLIRCYLNGYTYGTDGYFHTDSLRRDEHTTILFMNDYWEPDWAGETVFLGPGGDIIKAVLPRRNRALIFPSNIQHAGRSVSRKCTVLRKTLIFKARGRRSSDFEKLSAFLRKAGATGVAHRHGTLHDHLVRTYLLLEARGLESNVCFGGGLHAIYGTSRFGHAVLGRDARTMVIDEFGERAEELAGLFSSLQRPATLESPLELGHETAVVELRDGQSLGVQRSIFDDLRKIECANLADQGELGRYKTLNRLWEAERSAAQHPRVTPSPPRSTTMP